MSDNTDEAKALAETAATQAKHAGKNSGRALKALADPAIENAEEILEKGRGTAEDAVTAASKLDFGRVLSKASAGFLALSAASFCGAVGYSVFRELKTKQ